MFQITSPSLPVSSVSHFDHVFKMAEIADEPDEYLSDEERG